MFSVEPWGETEDPIAIVADLLGGATAAAMGDHTWSRFTVDLLGTQPRAHLASASEITSPIRAVKTVDEIARLRAAAEAVDRIASRLQGGEIELIGQTEAAVSAELGRQILDEGHHRVNFAIVAAGANAASPHHEAGDRVIAADEVVLCDFGGTWIGDDGVGYCSDITRCVWTGSPHAEFSELYEVLFEAQAAQVGVATPAPKLKKSTEWGARSSPTRATASTSCTGPATASGSRRTKTPTSSKATMSRSWPATPSASSRASTSRASGAPGSRTSSWPAQTPADPLNRVDHNLAVLS